MKGVRGQHYGSPNGKDAKIVREKANVKNILTDSRIIYFLFIFLFYFFLVKSPLEEKFPLFSCTDELLALCAVPFFLSGIRRKGISGLLEKDGYGRYILVFLLISLAGSLVYRYQPFFRAALPDLVICSKFWMTIYVGKRLFEKFSVSEYAGRIFLHIRAAVWIYFILMLADHLAALVGSGEGLFVPVIRYGLRSTHLFYSHPTHFASCCVFLLAVLTAVSAYVKGSGKYMLLLFVMLCSTLRSKSLGTAVVCGLVYYLVAVRGKKPQLRTFLYFVPLLLLIGINQIYYYFFSRIQDDSARYHMLVTGIRIANDHFPLGAGLGTFASHMSAAVYSPLYEIYGISNVWGLREGAAYFVSDTFWPMVLGQAGWFGLAFLLLGIRGLFFKIQTLYSVNTAFYLSALFILLYLLVSSAAESAFVHPSAIPLALWLGILMRRNAYEKPADGQQCCD